MASTEPQRCRWCGTPVKRGRACGSHSDLEKAYRELHGDEAAARSSVAQSTASSHDDAPIDPPGGAP